MKEKDDNALKMAIDTYKLWKRHRKGNEVPAAILDTIDALEIQTKAGLKPLPVEQRQEEYGWNMTFHLPAGLSRRDFEEKLHHFEEQSHSMIELSNKGHVLNMKIMSTKLENDIPFKWEGQFKGYVPIPIGFSPAGMLVVDLVRLPHLFIGGQPGSGKSNALQVIANSLLLSGRAIPIIIDLKGGLEFDYLSEHTIVATDLGEAIEVLGLLNEELDRRFQRLKGYRKWQNYPGDDMPYAVLVVDELAELQDKLCQDRLNRLCRLARAAGISVVAATQRPSHTLYKNFTDTRALFSATLAFYVKDETNSRMLLDNGRAAQLPKDIPGRAIWLWDTETVVQTMHFPEDEETVNKIVSTMPERKLILTNDGRMPARQKGIAGDRNIPLLNHRADSPALLPGQFLR